MPDSGEIQSLSNKEVIIGGIVPTLAIGFLSGAVAQINQSIGSIVHETETLTYSAMHAGSTMLESSIYSAKSFMIGAAVIGSLVVLNNALFSRERKSKSEVISLSKYGGLLASIVGSIYGGYLGHQNADDLLNQFSKNKMEIKSEMNLPSSLDDFDHYEVFQDQSNSTTIAIKHLSYN